ncbi:metallophosphoesterase [Caulobacter sp. DWR2-3-1b2]|uniref:metallophosphoesterase n=1 Tax=unclassified Caulobacter TaxID=2648921 RepID=UPI003CEC5F2B
MTGHSIMLLAWIGAVTGLPIVFTAWAFMRRSGRLRLAWAVAGLLLVAYGLGVWAFLVEPNLLVVRRVTIESRTWTGPPVRLGLISDTHVAAPHVDPARVARVVARMNAQHPDVVLLLGDYAGSHESAATRAAPQRSEILRGISAFQGLNPRLGVYAVLGNHDWWYDGGATEQALVRAGAHVLENRALRVARTKGPFWVAGLADLDSKRATPSYPVAMANVPTSEPVVVMSHWPDPFAQAPDRVALTVAGHTHCGQVNLPVMGRLVHASQASRQWGCGAYVDRGRNLFVTGGVGVSILPVRFRAPPEIVVVTLKGQDLRSE